MSKIEVQTLLQNALRAAEESRLWGNIQLDFQDGKLVLVRQTTTTKIREENNRNGSRY